MRYERQDNPKPGPDSAGSRAGINRRVMRDLACLRSGDRDADDQRPGKPRTIDPAGGEQSDRSVCHECLVNCEERLMPCGSAAVHGRLDEDLFDFLN